MTEQIFDYWIRELGLSLKISRIKPLANLQPGERLLALLLRGDAEGFKALIEKQDADIVWMFVSNALEYGFVRTAFQRLIEFNSLGTLSSEQSRHLLQLVSRETADREVSDEMLMHILGVLSKYAEDIVWIKGTSLARTIYRSPNFRVTGDFDFVVRRDKFLEVVQELKGAGFVEMIDSGYCNQIGVGPTITPSDLSLSPNPRLIASSAIALNLKDWPSIDIKLGPFDTGIQMVEINRFFEDATAHQLGEYTFLAPSHMDHLLLSLHNFAKDRFLNWKNLFDIHLLVAEINLAQEWSVFTERCKIEHLEHVAWAGLTLAKDRYSSTIPDAVLSELAPAPVWGRQFLLFTVSPYFVWNATSMPMLILNAMTSTDTLSKLKIIGQSLFPGSDFLSRYYAHGKPIAPLMQFILHFIHWLVMILPGGLVRQTFGKHYWPAEN